MPDSQPRWFAASLPTPVLIIRRKALTLQVYIGVLSYVLDAKHYVLKFGKVNHQFQKFEILLRRSVLCRISKETSQGNWIVSRNFCSVLGVTYAFL